MIKLLSVVLGLALMYGGLFLFAVFIMSCLGFSYSSNVGGWYKITPEARKRMKLKAAAQRSVVEIFSRIAKNKKISKAGS